MFDPHRLDPPPPDSGLELRERAKTENGTVVLAQGLREHQLEWCRTALSRALSLRS